MSLWSVGESGSQSGMFLVQAYKFRRSFTTTDKLSSMKRLYRVNNFFGLFWWASLTIIQENWMFLVQAHKFSKKKKKMCLPRQPVSALPDCIIIITACSPWYIILWQQCCLLAWQYSLPIRRLHVQYQCSVGVYVGWGVRYECLQLSEYLRED